MNLIHFLFYHFFKQRFPRWNMNAQCHDAIHHDIDRQNGKPVTHVNEEKADLI